MPELTVLPSRFVKTPAEANAGNIGNQDTRVKGSQVERDSAVKEQEASKGQTSGINIS